MARLVRLGLLRLAASRPEAVEDPPGVVVLQEDGGVEVATPAARRWLQELDSGDSLPPSVRSLNMLLLAGKRNSLSVRAPRASGGWLRIHVSRLYDGEEQKTSVVLEPVKPVGLAGTVAQLYGFTQRECDVIKLLAQGLSDKEIGKQLGISPFTVNDHSKSVFSKAGVQSRQQLVAALFFGHYLPRWESQASPGPYGWFLEVGRGAP